VEEGISGFDVIELQGGTSSVTFVYRVVAKREGYEAKRLDYCKAAERDSYLYPELREKERREHEAQRVRIGKDRGVTPHRAARSLEEQQPTDN
jgi:hypothetical protein